MADRHQILKPLLIRGDDERHRIAPLGELANRGVALVGGAPAQSFAGRAVLICERLAREMNPDFGPNNRRDELRRLGRISGHGINGKRGYAEQASILCSRLYQSCHDIDQLRISRRMTDLVDGVTGSASMSVQVESPGGISGLVARRLRSNAVERRPMWRGMDFNSCCRDWAPFL